MYLLWQKGSTGEENRIFHSLTSLCSKAAGTGLLPSSDSTTVLGKEKSSWNYWAAWKMVKKSSIPIMWAIPSLQIDLTFSDEGRMWTSIASSSILQVFAPFPLNAFSKYLKDGRIVASPTLWIFSSVKTAYLWTVHDRLEDPNHREREWYAYKLSSHNHQDHSCCLSPCFCWTSGWINFQSCQIC